MNERPVNVLLVEDNPDYARLVREILGKARNPGFTLTHVGQFSKALNHLMVEGADVILLDLSLPDADGLEAVREAHRAVPGVPLVVLTGLNDEELAASALQEGAQDYLVKAQVESQQLSRALRYAIERHRLQASLLDLTLTDDLTGLHNRRGFLTLGEQHLKLARRTKQSFLLVFMDLDGLKQINDTYGHQEGNRALVRIANVLRNCFRESDIRARLGGDEFGVLMVDAPRGALEMVRRRLGEKLDHCNQREDHRHQLALSVGILPCSGSQRHSLEELLAQADVLMYEQKRNKGAPTDKGLVEKQRNTA